MGSIGNKQSIALAVLITVAATPSILLAQPSGLDHYAARLGYPPSRTHAEPRARSASQQASVRQTSYPQLDIQTQQPDIYRANSQRLAKRFTRTQPARAKAYDVIERYGQSQSSAERAPNINAYRTQRSGSDTTDRSGSDAAYRSRTDATYRKTSGRPIRFGRTAARSTRQSQDVFGEDQVPDAAPKNQRNDRPTPDPVVPAPVTSPDTGGVVLPPGALDDLREPKLPGGNVVTPEVMPDQDLPIPGQVPPSSPRRTPQKPRRTPAPSESNQPKRKKYDNWGSDEIEYQGGGSSPNAFHSADPRPPSAGNGPESWYRGGSNGQPAPEIQNWPQGFSDPNVYAGQPQYHEAPSYPGNNPPPAQHYIPQAGSHYAPSNPGMPGAVYASADMPACNGTPGYANGGCNSCGTGMVNGCQESIFYLSFFGGYTDMDSVSVVDEALGDFLFELEEGYVVGGALGQYQGRNLRTEIEFSFRENDLAALTAPGNPLFPIPPLEDAGIQSYSGMANVMWEFVEFPCDRIKPYVGAGFGFVNIQIQGITNGMNALNGVDDSDSSFGYQWMAGLKYSVNESMDLFGEYRFLKADSLQLGGFGFDYETSNIIGGVRLNF